MPQPRSDFNCAFKTVVVLFALSTGVLAGCSALSRKPAADLVVASDPSVAGEWRTKITPEDQARYDRRVEAWQMALAQARSQPGRGNFAEVSAVVDTAGPVLPVDMATGTYRCRNIKLGSQGGDGGWGYIVYGWYQCRVDQTAEGLQLRMLTGAQRPQGLFYPESDTAMVFLGTVALSAENAPPPYGQARDRNIVSIVERVGDRHWRIWSPWPHHEANVDILELIPAG